MARQWNDGERWPARKWAARLTRVLVLLLPIVAAVVVAVAVASALPDPTTLFPTLGWWIAVIGSSLAASFVVSREAAKLLPLAALLNMSLLFPDEAPSRFKIALRSGSSGLLRKEVVRARAAGADDDPTRAAEYALTLVASLGKHDRTTRGHAERTRAYADLLADELGLSDGDRDRLRWAALLHDIGKVKVDADILQKDTPLDDSEWDIVREHPVLGYELVTPIREFLGPWAQTILHHHERFDGLGYPSGVAGEDISLGARIVAVADAYDAMTAARTYQEPIPRKTALTELTSSAGSQFDPAIVRAFLQISVSRVRAVMGPFVVLAQLPFIGGLRRVADSGALVMAAVVGLFVPIAVGVGPGSDETTEPSPVVVEAAAPNDGGGEGSAANPSGASGPEGDPDAGAAALDPAASSTTSSVASSTTPPSTSTTTAPSTTASPTTEPPATTTTTTTTTRPPATTTTTTTRPPATTTTSTTSTTTTTTTTTVAPQPPAVAPDSATTDEDVATTIDVLANDSDADGDLDPSSLRISIPAALGTATIAAGLGPVAPVIAYAPLPDANGADAFDYEVCDLAARCSVGTVSITVVPVNDVPLAVDDSASAPPLTPVEVDVVANDSDVDSVALVIESFDAVSSLGGTVDCVATCTYTPPALWAADDSFSYTVKDGHGGSATALVTVTPEMPDLLWYLRAAAAGDTTASLKLPLSSAAGPSNAVLPNLDTDRDSAPGLLLVQAPPGSPQQLAETDPTKFQLWTYDVADDLHMLGNGTVSLHAGMQGLAANLDARVRAFLLDCPATTIDGTDCTTIATATVTGRPWSETPDIWVTVAGDLGVVDYSVAAGRAVAVKVVVAGGASEDDMWFAFDTVGLLSVLHIQAVAPAAAFRLIGLR